MISHDVPSRDSEESSGESEAASESESESDTDPDNKTDTTLDVSAIYHLINIVDFSSYVSRVCFVRQISS